MFTSGKVQAAALPMYELIPYMVGGLKLRIFHHPILADLANAGYLASPATLTVKHDAIARFSRAIVKAALLPPEGPKRRRAPSSPPTASPSRMRM